MCVCVKGIDTVKIKHTFDNIINSPCKIYVATIINGINNKMSNTFRSVKLQQNTFKIACKNLWDKEKERGKTYALKKKLKHFFPKIFYTK